jgi:hypothetical protein
VKIVRLLALAGAVAIASAPAAPAHADPLCESVAISGAVNETFPFCKNDYPYGVTCATPKVENPTLTVIVHVCAPSPAVATTG